MSTILIKQRSMKYQSALERNRCANCHHNNQYWDDKGERSGLKIECKLGGFFTTTYAICDEHQPFASTTKATS